MNTGSCHCGKVKYETAGKELLFLYCHCPDCRITSGSPFSAVLISELDGFRVTAGADQLTDYPSSPGKHRFFCKTCGSHLFAKADARPGVVIMRAGTLNEAPQLKPQAHCWTTHKADWDDLAYAEVKYPEGLPPK